MVYWIYWQDDGKVHRRNIVQGDNATITAAADPYMNEETENWLKSIVQKVYMIIEVLRIPNSSCNDLLIYRHTFQFRLKQLMQGNIL